MAAMAGRERTGIAGRDMSRRGFLKLGGAGLAGEALLGTVGCGGASGDDSGNLVFSMSPDSTGTRQKLVDAFNGESDGFKVEYREMPADSNQYFDKLMTEFLPRTIEANTYDGKVYGVPWFTNPGMLYYRQDLLEESGFSEPPATWDELKEMSQKVQKDAGARYGSTFQGSNYETRSRKRAPRAVFDSAASAR